MYNKNKGLYLGLYRKELDLLDRQTDFISFIGQRKHFTEVIHTKDPYSTSRTSELVDLRRIPAIWEASMHIAIKYNYPRPEDCIVGGLKRLGHISIQTKTVKNKHVASTVFYFPRTTFGMALQEWPDNAPGLGYATEGMMFWSLRDSITHARTGSHPAQPRVDQLKRAGLPTCKEVPINEWLEGLLRGFRQSIETAKAAMSNATE